MVGQVVTPLKRSLLQNRGSVIASGDLERPCCVLRVPMSQQRKRNAVEGIELSVVELKFGRLKDLFGLTMSRLVVSGFSIPKSG